jgi:hypothetical protein
LAGDSIEKEMIMATYHLSIKSGKRGSAANHAAYIAREGKFGKNLQETDLVAMEYGNMPDWALGNPNLFWKMADRHERSNGAAYCEFELALPSELNQEQRSDLVDDFISNVVGNKPYQRAIHEPTASLGGIKQPHAHVMTSGRVPDAIERSPELHFKRYNPVHPELGGCKKDSCGRTPATLKNDVKFLRATWAELQNQHLEMSGHDARVDHRSNGERGIEKRAEKHLGAAAIKQMTEEDKASIQDKRTKSKKQNA